MTTLPSKIWLVYTNIGLAPYTQYAQKQEGEFFALAISVISSFYAHKSIHFFAVKGILCIWHGKHNKNDYLRDKVNSYLGHKEPLLSNTTAKYVIVINNWHHGIPGHPIDALPQSSGNC